MQYAAVEATAVAEGIVFRVVCAFIRPILRNVNHRNILRELLQIWSKHPLESTSTGVSD